ncbi:MAG: MMPL family transporter [Bdellovibrionota bacterium]
MPSLLLCLNLKLMSDFKRLLPQNKPSVVSLNKIVEKVGGVGVHEIVIEGDDPESMIAFIDDLVIALKKLPEKYVRIVDYRIDDVKAFFEAHKYLYLDTNDLRDIEERLRKKIEYEKMIQNPFFFDLEEEEVVFDISDIEEKYRSQTQEQEKYYKGYLFSHDKKLAVVLIHPSGATTGTKFSKELAQVIAKVVDQVNPTSYHPSIQVSYSGKFLKVLRQFEQLIQDMVQTLGLCLFFVALVLYLYFRRVRVILILTLALAVGSIWTFALAQVFIGSLNSQTAFLGSIIVGNGVNSGIFLLARYLEERRKSLPYLESIELAVQKTFFSTFAAAITTSVAFIALSESEIQGMSEFGFIGGAGMLFCWIATYTFIPAVLSLSEKYVPMHKTAEKVSGNWSSVFTKLEAWIQRRYRPVVVASVLTLMTASILAINFIPTALEYDFSNLKNKYEKTAQEKARDQRKKSVFGESLNPSIILADREAQVDGLCETVMELEKDVPAYQKTISSCKNLQDFVPEEQDEKMQLLGNIRQLLADDSIKPVYKKYKKDIDDLNQSATYEKITMGSLPETIRRKYQEKDGRLGRLAFVYSNKQSNISNGKQLIKHTDVLTNIKLKDGSQVSISGDYPIFSDLLKAIKRDGPIVSLLSFLCVVLLIVLYFRNLKAIVVIVGSLLFSTILLLGIQSAYQIKLNFFNYIALPVTFGIGVDYAVNLYHRYQLEGVGKVLFALRTTGGAIVLCSMTTMIGYLSLTQGINQAMVSFGWLAFIGEVSCIVAGLIMIPAMLHYWDLRKTNSRSS